MRAISFTELRNNAKACFDAVEMGETLEVLRRGKPIAQIRPVRSDPHPRWINRPKLVRLKAGTGLSGAVLKERSGARY